AVTVHNQSEPILELPHSDHRSSALRPLDRLCSISLLILGQATQRLLAIVLEQNQPVLMYGLGVNLLPGLQSCHREEVITHDPCDRHVLLRRTKIRDEKEYLAFRFDFDRLMPRRMTGRRNAGDPGSDHYDPV